MAYLSTIRTLQVSAESGAMADNALPFVKHAPQQILRPLGCDARRGNCVACHHRHCSTAANFLSQLVAFRYNGRTPLPAFSPDRPVRDDDETTRAARTSAQWLGSIEAYLAWRAGVCWRNDRLSAQRRYYLDGLLTLKNAQRQNEWAGLSPVDLFPDYFQEKLNSARASRQSSPRRMPASVPTSPHTPKRGLA